MHLQSPETDDDASVNKQIQGPYHSDIDMVLIRLISHANFNTETTRKPNWSVVLLGSWKLWLRAQVILGLCINLTSMEKFLYYP